MNHLKQQNQHLKQQNQQNHHEDARRSGLKEAGAVVAACALVGKPELASGFLEKRMGIAAVMTALKAVPATGDAQPAARDVSAQFLARCRASADKEKAELRNRHEIMRRAGVTVLVQV